jgi:hypothetical protein
MANMCLQSLLLQGNVYGHVVSPRSDLGSKTRIKDRATVPYYGVRLTAAFDKEGTFAPNELDSWRCDGFTSETKQAILAVGFTCT